jgi:aminoglycoside/choline kinase family phosphotransferase
MEHGTAVWASERWRARAVAWLDERLAATGTVRTGEVTQPRVRPWGTVLTAPTDEGQVWLKAPAPPSAYEVPLYLVLARVVADQVPRPIAVDVERGLLLLADGGSAVGAGREAAAAITVLPRYAELQRALAPHARALLAAGVPDMRPAVMPGRFDEAVAAVSRYVERHGGEDDRETLRRVSALRATFSGWCERLAASPVPASLDHNDLHPGNVLTDDEGRVRFHDWGDGVVAHPFASMLVALGRLGAPSVFRRVRDSYLATFTDLAPRAALVAELELACRLAKVARALTWERALAAADPLADHEVLRRFARAPLETLGTLLAESPFALP